MIQKAKLPLIIFDTLLILVIGYFMAGILFYPKSEQTVKLDGITQTEKEDTESAKTKEEVSKIVEKENTSGQTKGTTQYVAPKNYQPTAKSKATTKKVTQAKQVIKKPEVKPSLPDISEPSPTTDYPFSDEHVQGYIDNNSEYQDILGQINAIYLQSLDLYEDYLNVPETAPRGVGLSFRNLWIESKEEEILHEIAVLELEYKRLEFRLDQLDNELCSTYWDILYYLESESYCN